MVELTCLVAIIEKFIDINSRKFSDFEIGKSFDIDNKDIRARRNIRVMSIWVGVESFKKAENLQTTALTVLINLFFSVHQ